MTGFTFFTFCSYLALSLYFWRTRWHLQIMISPRRAGIERIFLTAILCLHAYSIFPGILQSDYLYFGTSKALSVIAWVAIMSYWVATFSDRLDGLQPLLFFMGALLVGLHLILPTDYEIIIPATPLFKTHFLLAMLAYGLMLYAVWLALLIGIADRQLHFARKNILLSRLPSLLTLEKYLFSSITIGFILLTFALITGFSFPTQEYDRFFHFSHKVIFPLLSWFVFAILLWGRQYRGWRGRFAVNWVILGFILLVLGYLGSSFLYDYLSHGKS